MSDIRKYIFDLQKTRSYINYNKYHHGNIFSITKTSRNELMHSNFIKWLLDINEYHKLGSYPVEQLIKSLIFVKAKKTNNYSRLDENLIYRFYDNITILNIEVFREMFNIDIRILVYTNEKILPIIIENKVESGLSYLQTDKYFINEENRYWDRNKYFEPIYILLHPVYNDVIPDNENFIKMSYQEFVDYIIDPSYYKCDVEKAKNNIMIYLQCLSYQDDYEKGENIMAISNEERKIIKEFIEENKDLLLLTLDELSDDLSDKYKSIISEQLKTSVRDNSEYNFNGQKYKKRRLVLAVLKQYVKDNPYISFEELQNKFKLEKYGQFFDYEDILKEKYNHLKDDVSTRYFVDDPIRLSSGKNILVCNQWSIEYLPEFIEKANSLGFNITKVDL